MDIADTITDLLGKRDPAASICPSQVARALTDDEAAWRALMPQVREAAAALANAGRIVITQRDHEVAAENVGNGPIRLRRGATFPIA